MSYEILLWLFGVFVAGVVVGFLLGIALGGYCEGQWQKTHHSQQK